MADYITGNSHVGNPQVDNAREELASLVANVRAGLTDVSRAVDSLWDEVERLSARISALDTGQSVQGAEVVEQQPARGAEVVEQQPAQGARVVDQQPMHDSKPFEAAPPLVGPAEGGWPAPGPRASSSDHAPEQRFDAFFDDSAPASPDDELPADEDLPAAGPPNDAPSSPTEEADPADIREQVRLEVERARAAIAAGQLDVFDQLSGEDEPDGLSRQAPAAETPPADEMPLELAPDPRVLEFPPHRDDRPIIINPVVVVDDQSGRVELVRVYEALSSVGYAGQASLINYTPHTVKVGLAGNTMPDTEALAEAVEKAFGRLCEVAVDGNRITVSLRDRRSYAA